MFKVGDYIIYGNTGVCKVEDIGTLNKTGISNERIYYTLTPIYSESSKVFTPVDNKKIVMRPIITKEEAISLIDDMKNIETIDQENDRNIEEVYKEELKSCNLREYVRLIKTLYVKKQDRISQGKKATGTSEKYFNIAEDMLYGELAVALNMNKEEVVKFIENKMEEE